MSHLQFDWQSPVWRHFLTELRRIATVIRYDERGHGLSDRGVTDHSLAARLADLEAVVEDAGLERFALMAMAQGGPVAIEYSARNPEDRALKAKHAAMWASGNYPAVVDDVVHSLGGILVATIDVQAGQLVLDVAAGTGTSAIPARKGSHTGRLRGTSAVRPLPVAVETRFLPSDYPGRSGRQPNPV